MRSLCSPAFYVPGIGMGWRGVVSRENADGWPWRAITKRLTIRACMALTAQGSPAWWPQAVARSRSARLLRDRPLPPTQKRGEPKLTANPTAALPTEQETVAGI